MTINPVKYHDIRPDLKIMWGDIHNIGLVWASILFDVYWELVDKHGFSSDWFSIKNQNKGVNLAGNVQFLKVLVDGMKIQPCNPTFIDARNAILQADQSNFDGSNFCELWRGFARRGLGVDAKINGKDGFKIPSKCRPWDIVCFK